MSAEAPAPTPDRAAVRGLPPLYFVGPLALALVLQFLVLPLPLEFSGGPAHTAVWRAALGALVGACGIALFGFTVAAHRRAGNDPHPTSPTTALILTGPYRVSRNPGYLGFALLQTGIALAIGSLWALGSVVVSVLLAHYLAVLPEERYLERKFGDPYRRYRDEVRRWI